MDVREKLVELIHKAKLSMWGKNGLSNEKAQNSYIADYLIAHSVTVQRWVSANEPPKENCKQVLIALSWDDTDIGWYDKEDKCWRSEYVNCYDVGEVTHWQYLPQPPKGE